MTIALLATGNEIIEGDILNTNGRDLAHILHSEGLSPKIHMATSDTEEEILECLQFLSDKHDVIIITGGLGPTSDDRTRFALSRFLNQSLVVFDEALEHLQNILRHSSLALTVSNRQQALFPEAATLMPNPFGTAMGCYCAKDNKLYFLLPGPPRECLPMFQDYVLPQLETTRGANQWLKWRLFGVAESEIGQQMDDALRHIPCETGYRLEMPYVEFKVRCEEKFKPTVREIVDPLVAHYIIASTEKKASEALIELIIKRKQRISIVDEVTGGLLESLILKPETRSLLDFCGQKKLDHVFHLKGLREYWQQEKGTTTSISISYKDSQESQQIESHQIPFRSAMVLYYAAEWLSFRLFHLINELH